MAKVLFTSNVNSVIEKRPKQSESLGLVATFAPRTT